LSLVAVFLGNALKFPRVVLNPLVIYPVIDIGQACFREKQAAKDYRYQPAAHNRPMLNISGCPIG
jgi:hypothetical protein